MTGHDIVAIGASAGGFQPLMDLLRELPRDLPASVLAVVHTSPGPSRLAEVIARGSSMEASSPADGDAIERGRVYIAPPDYHMLVEDGRIRLSRGPKENRFRPAVDPLFRTAAASRGPRVVGVVLSGAMDDGAAGLAAIKRHGGIAVVQDPDDAVINGMPRAALRAVDADYTVAAARMPELIAQLARSAPAGREAMEPEAERGELAGLSCPECDGSLFAAHEGGAEYMICRIGHRLSLDSLIDAQCERMENALWVAVRCLEERAALLERAAAKAPERERAALSLKSEEARAKARAVRNAAES